VLDRLETVGFIRRTPDPTDRRRVVIEALPENFIKDGAADPYREIVEELRRMHDDFSTEDLEVVARYLERLSRDSPGDPSRYSTPGS
jgi:DNA-binding MarR family transcriptional regulator